MKGKLSLPIKATRGAAVRKAVPVLLIGSLPMALVVSYGLSLAPLLPIFFAAALPVLVFLSGVFMALLLASKAKVADIMLDKEFVTVKPVKILGFGKGKSARYKLSDFASIGAHSKKQGRYDANYIILRARKKGRDLYLDVPSGKKPETYVYQLGKTLNLETDNDA